MRINFLILAHKNLSQLIRLIDRLTVVEGVYVYVHIDRKWDISLSDIERLHKDNVIVLPYRHSCFLDDWSLISATNDLLKRAVETTPANTHCYYYLLSGQDYPIKNIASLLRLLKNTYPQPYIDCTPYSKDNWLYQKFRTSVHRFVLKLKTRFIRRPLLGILLILEPVMQFFNLSHEFERKGIEMFGGSAWWCLPDIMIKEILEDMNDGQLLKSLRKIRTPEEVVYQILAKRTSLSDMIVLNNPDCRAQNCLTYANFVTPTKPFVGHPHLITMDDINLIKIKDEYFARKFDENVDAEILDIIDKTILMK